MKINRLETHDRLQHFKKDQESNVFKGAEDCLKVNSLSLALQEKSPYVYLFAHPRTADDGITKVMYWQPRLTKPKSQTNSYLFRVQSKSDIIEVCWLLPPREMWPQYDKGKVTENPDVMWSIDMFENHREELERPHAQDLNEDICKKIYDQVIAEHKEHLRRNKLYNSTIKEELRGYQKI